MIGNELIFTLDTKPSIIKELKKLVEKYNINFKNTDFKIEDAELCDYYTNAIENAEILLEAAFRRKYLPNIELDDFMINNGVMYIWIPKHLKLSETEVVNICKEHISNIHIEVNRVL